MGTFNDRGALDPAQGVIAVCFGKKRSGKSVMGRLLFASYPYDRVVIAANADDGPFTDPDDDIFEITGSVDDLPARWPEHLRRRDNAGPRRMTLRYVPDHGSPTRIEDQDHVVGMAMAHGHCAILFHEIGLIAESNRVPPHTRRLLHANRHEHVTAIMCGPRPVTVDPLVIGQADLVYVFEMQVVADRKRVAETIGWNIQDFVDAVEDLGPHEYLRYDANQAKPTHEGETDMRLIHCPALPVDIVKQVQR